MKTLDLRKAPLIVTVLLSSFQSLVAEGPSSHQLSPEQKKTDFKFLTDLVREQSPFVVLNHAQKRLSDVNALAAKYIERAGETDDDKDFLRLVQEYINRIRHTGHQMIMGKNLAKGYSGEAKEYAIRPAAFEKHSYWDGYLSYAVDWFAAYSPAKIGYWKGNYSFIEDYKSQEPGEPPIPTGTRVLTIDGIEPNDYALRQQDKAILNFDAANSRLYLRDLLCVDPGHGVKGWVLECLLPDGQRRTLIVPKQMGYAPCPPDWRMTLLELDETTAYVRMPNFAPVERAADEKKLSLFLAGGSRWKRLIIDVRENQGGDPTLWVNCLVAPLIRKELAWTQDSLVRKAWAEEHSNLYPMNPKGFVELWPKAQGQRVDKRDLPLPGEWEVYRMTRTVSPLRGGLFGLSSKSGFKGKVYLLIDDRSFSAADDFAHMAQLTGFATLVGTATLGGTANLAKPTPVCLPESMILLWLEFEATLTPDGKISELTGTLPDVELPPARVPAAITREAILSDPWVRWVIRQ